MKNALGAVQTVLVLGGDSDIANATIRQLINHRTSNVVLAGRDLDRLELRAESIRSSGNVDVQTVHFDALNYSSHGTFVNEVFQRESDIDLVLLAFGVLGDQRRDERDADAALRTIQINFVGAVSVTIPIIEQLKRQGHGTLVTMSTVAAERPRRSNFIYGASKAGLDWFVQGYSDALQGSGVNLVLVRPGFVHSKMTRHLDAAPLPANPDQVASAIIVGIARNREIVWVPGKLRWVMSVLRHLPRSIFRRLNL